MSITWQDIVAFHGHACPGLAKGYVMIKAAMEQLGVEHAHDEELVAIVENKSCAVDAVQVYSGCTFGKGNFIFLDYGKQVITLIRRSDRKAVRVAMKSDVSKQRLAKEMNSEDYVSYILEADPSDMLQIAAVEVELPAPAEVYKTLICSRCGEGVMEPAARMAGDSVYCLPCWQEQTGLSTQDPTNNQS